MHAYAVAVAWGYIAVHNDIGHYILTELSATAWFYPTIFIHDLAINTVLIVPGAVIVAFFLDPSRKRHFAPFYGVLLYIWPHHLEAVKFGFPIHPSPTTIFTILVFILVPWALIRMIQRKTHAAA